MNDIFAIMTDKFLVLFLVFVRMTSLFVVTPIFGRRNMPNYLKVGLAFFCAIILTPLIINTTVEFVNIFSFAMIIIKEFLVGIILGYISFVVFSALYVAGQIIDMQLGYGMVSILDPMMDAQVPLMGNFLYILATLLFLLIDGHHILLQALFKSYMLVPINGFVFTDALINNVVLIFSEVFIIAFKISLPILAASILTEVAMGILSKTVPQMNVYVVGMPLKVGVGLITLYLTLPIFVTFQNITFDKMYSYIYLIIKSMAKG